MVVGTVEGELFLEVKTGHLEYSIKVMRNRLKNRSYGKSVIRDRRKIEDFGMERIRDYRTKPEIMRRENGLIQGNGMQEFF